MTGMLIRIVYRNGRYDEIKPFLLDRLIESGKVKKFFRSDGWVVVGRDPLRGRDEHFEGPEKRQKTPIYHLL
jgi:hypothetical protein